MTHAVTAQGDRLQVEIEPGTWTDIMEIKSIPEIGETPVKVDSTNLDSQMREYIKGLSDQSDLEFVGNAVPVSVPGSNVALVMSMSRSGEYRWRWLSPKLGVQVIWRGQFAYRFGAGEVDTVRDLIISVIPMTRPIESKITATYTVTYNANGGSGGPVTDSTTYEHGQIVTTKPNGFTAPPGKSFVAWNTKADNGGDMYDAGDTFPIYVDTTLYAIWSD